MTVNHDVTGSSPVGGAKNEYSLSTVGVDDAGGPPVPIPNTEVKPCSAEDSCLVTDCENRKMPTSDSGYSFFIPKYPPIVLWNGCFFCKKGFQNNRRL